MTSVFLIPTDSVTSVFDRFFRSPYFDILIVASGFLTVAVVGVKLSNQLFFNFIRQIK